MTQESISSVGSTWKLLQCASVKAKATIQDQQQQETALPADLHIGN